MDDLRIIISIIIAIFGTGGLFGYWLKSKMDSKQKEREWKKQYYLHDLKRKADLLHEFLREPLDALVALCNPDTNKDEKWRKEKANIVRKWVKHHQSFFPDKEGTFTTIYRVAEALVCHDGKIATSPRERR